MLFCVNCGNHIKSNNQYKLTGCPRWRYYIKCDCGKRNDYKYFVEHKILFTSTLQMLHLCTFKRPIL